MKKIALTVSIAALMAGCQKSQEPLYKDAKAPVEARVQDLLKRMTPEEKIGQLMCPLGWEMYTRTETGVEVSDLFKKHMDSTMPIGSFWAVLRADPWTQKTLENGLNPILAAEALNKLQHYAIEKTRLGIPVLFAEEIPHGHMAIGTTVFPTGLGMASTWNEELIEQVGSAIALEARLQGAGVGYGPVLDIAREPRWSRVEETMGEDPVLTGAMGIALVKGIQGKNVSDGKHLYATLKHFAAYGVPEGGHNGDRTMIGQRQLFSELLPQFRKAVQAGVGGIMTSYNAIDGIPCTANEVLLNEVLRHQWGFNGFIYSDLASIDGIWQTHHVAANMQEAGEMALKATVDMDLGAQAYGELTLQSLKEGKIDISIIDKAVANVLRTKFNLGLFENPYVSKEEAAKYVHCEKHRELARQVAREGTVLLKNDGILPLSKDIKSIAVVGPNADMMYNQLGDYTAPQDSASIITPLRGIIEAVSANTKVTYVKGCAIRDVSNSDIPTAVKIAKQADVTVLFVGGSSARDFKTKYIHTGAATVDESVKEIPDMDCGEGFDRQTLNLLGDQEKLMQALFDTGKPVVVVYIEGRPLNMNLATEKANALLTAWYPGGEGGHGIADVLFGEYNPAGRLPISIPRSEGQIPVTYSKGNQRSYMDGEGNALFSFGYGLSYTTFAYTNLECKTSQTQGELQTISCTVTNTGNRDGAEIVQLYINDQVASVAQPSILLKAFKRIELKAGETKNVKFVLKKSDLAILNSQMKEVVEPGAFTVMIGAASNDIRLTGEFNL